MDKTTQGDRTKCSLCLQLLGKRVVDKKSPAPKCPVCGGLIDLDAVDRAGDILIKEEHEEQTP